MTVPPNFQDIGTSVPAEANAIIDVAANDQWKTPVRVATAAALPAPHHV